MQPFMITCPGCGTRFSVRTPKALGQTRSCPKCAAPIEIVDPNAPLEPPRPSMPWNRWALAGGTIAALLVIAAMLLISRGGAADSSLEQSEALADASVPAENEQPPADDDDAIKPDNPQPAPPPEPAPVEQETEPTTEPLQAEVESLLDESAQSEPVAPESAGPPEVDQEQPADTPRVAAPSAAQRGRSTDHAPGNSPGPPPSAILGPTTRPGAGQSDAGDANGPTVGPSDGAVDPDSHAGENDPEPPAADDPVYHRLHRKIVFYECDKHPLDLLVQELSDLSALDVSIDYAALDALRIDFGTPISLKLEDTNLVGILTAIVEPLELSYVVTGRKVLITAPSEPPDQDDQEPKDDNP